MSLNDPQWGRKGGGGPGGTQGPPDLDELWRSFNQRLNGIFGRRGGGGTGGEPPGMRQISGGAGLIAGLILVVWLASGFYIVDESQRGVVLTFGKYSETSRPGLRWRLPYPFQSHELWFLTEDQRWGILPPDLDTKAIIAKVNREDIWRDAAKAIGVAAADIPAGTSRGKETFFDGKVFDPADPKGYLASLSIK